MRRAAPRGAAVSTDEWSRYARLAWDGYQHATVNHSEYEWARGGDRVHKVHCNTLEGLWTGLRNFLRPFPGASKAHLAQYLAIFEWANNLRRVTDEFLGLLLGAPHSTDSRS